MSHDHHDHHDHHHHHHTPPNTPEAQKTLVFVLSLTIGFFFVEILGGFWTGSIALLSDAGHMFTDISALSLSLFAMRFSHKEATLRKSYGFHRFEVLAAFINATLLMIAASTIFLEALERLKKPQDILALEMIGIAALGLVVNIVALFALSRHGDHSLNMKGALLHVIGDMLGSVGAVFAGVLIYFTQWTLIDPIVSFFICLLILVGAWNLLWKSIHVLMEGVPEGFKLEELKETMMGVGGVEEICDLHIWSLNSNITMLTAHVRVKDFNESKSILLKLLDELKNHYKIHHVTIQMEDASFPTCQSLIV